jgi:hypothetical protein
VCARKPGGQVVVAVPRRTTAEHEYRECDLVWPEAPPARCGQGFATQRRRLLGLA